ncbi:MAG: non-ribosomal peptide synthetase module [Clostridiaceae bacterium]|nr:non-ribosomal peptide synthetase module [Clostridiaceae bacterium]
MLYEEENIIQAFKIYTKLALNGESDKDSLRMYMADDTVRGLVDQFVKEVDCTTFLAGEKIYMVPLSMTSPFHVANEELKQKYLPTRAVNMDLYMMYITIIILFGEFYDSYQTMEPTRDFIQMEHWLNCVNEKMNSIKDHDQEQLKLLEEEYEYNWIAIVEKWDAMDDIKEKVQQTARTVSRMSFLNSVKNFLVQQQLIYEMGNDEVNLTEKAKIIIQRYYMEQEFNRGILEFIYNMERRKKEEIENA